MLSSRSPTNLGAPDDVAVSQDKAVGCNNHPGTPDCVTAAMGQIAALIPLAREVLWALFLSLRAIALRRSNNGKERSSVVMDDQERSADMKTSLAIVLATAALMFGAILSLTSPANLFGFPGV
jgi:hypothetical protein